MNNLSQQLPDWDSIEGKEEWVFLVRNEYGEQLTSKEAFREARDLYYRLEGKLPTK